jgi:hypothetical protein
MKERGSMYEHFPLCGSARAAIRGRLLTKEFSNKNLFPEKKRFGAFSDSGFGRFRRYSDGFVIILARNPDEKCCHGVN